MPDVQERPPCPEIKWAQRKDRVFLTICLEDVKNPEVSLKEKEVAFKGIGGTDQKLHACNLDLFGEIDPARSKYEVTARNVDMVLMRKEPGPFWPRLIKLKGRVPWITTDFNRWRDEDESEEEDSKFDFESMMGRMGGMGDAPDMGDLNLPDDDEEENDDDLPELEEVDRAGETNSGASAVAEVDGKVAAAED